MTFRRATSEVWNEIQGVTGPLEKTLKALAENPNGTASGKKQAEDTGKIVGALNAKGAQIALAAQATHTQSLGMGMRRGGSSAPIDEKDDKDK
jgi:hypothetical protein